MSVTQTNNVKLREEEEDLTSLRSRLLKSYSVSHTVISITLLALTSSATNWILKQSLHLMKG